MQETDRLTRPERQLRTILTAYLTEDPCIRVLVEPVNGIDSVLVQRYILVRRIRGEVHG
ncbi:hypothetical protein [Rhodococcus wratislaviensis]|uniref:Uncharacterized protein n=1 Tax=Rhodococcus wratislaviensis NBRC 100605 TaxID=1219028 RepID=X0R1G0_RHOWR|nr:hypothetical protein [Rhodococcus wratislaviensis]GAF44725.1 hypothetical protein RW1_014_01880 [Rhodococcus wratislaviensis NBRC 100605]